jgi:hypothetical protein
MTKLYGVKTVVAEFKGHRDVSLSWFVTKRACPVQRPYTELIAGYDAAQKDQYAEDAINELFSKAEARSFVDWLKSNRGATDEDTKIVEVALPIPENRIGLGAIAVGGPTDFLDMEKDARLGFRVSGYYDLRAHEPIDKSVPPRHAFCSIYVFGDRIVNDYDELLELWRAGKIVADPNPYFY